MKRQTLHQRESSMVACVGELVQGGEKKGWTLGVAFECG